MGRVALRSGCLQDAGAAQQSCDQQESTLQTPNNGIHRHIDKPGGMRTLRRLDDMKKCKKKPQWGSIHLFIYINIVSNKEEEHNYIRAHT